MAQVDPNMEKNIGALGNLAEPNMQTEEPNMQTAMMDKDSVRAFFSDYLLDKTGKSGTLSDNQILDLIINMGGSDDPREATLGRDLWEAFTGDKIL